MIYFFFSLIINIFLLYIVYKKLVAKYTEPNRKEISEINSLIIEFNKIAKNNIDLLEDRLEQIKEYVKLFDLKLKELNSLENKEAVFNNIKNNSVIPLSPSKNQVKANKSTKRKLDKFSVIKKMYLEDKKRASTIAKQLGISKGEVDLYIELIKKS